jgi:hypothetical protein
VNVVAEKVIKQSVWTAKVVPQPAREPEGEQCRAIDFTRLISIAQDLQKNQREKVSVRALKEMEAVRLLQV